MSRVALIGENSVEYIDTLLGIWNNGDCAVLLDWRIPFQTAVQLMQEADVQKCYIEKKQLHMESFLLPKDIEFITFEKKSNSAEYLPEEIYKKYKPNYSRDEAVVIYSSGTTGKSKGIILSYYAINTNAEAIIDYMNLIPDDCIYIAKTLSHSSTLTGELLVALKTHTRIIVAPTIVPPRYILANIKKYSVSIICLNPTLLLMLVEELHRGNYSISELRTLYVSGSILNDKLYNKSHETLKDIAIYNVYGLSEAGPRVTAQTADCCKSNSVGKPIKGIDVAVVDEQGNPIKETERGIIHVNTPSRFEGYISGAEKHRSLYKGWLNTGDIGCLNEYGELHIVDRVDDVIFIDSHKIYPSEIERQIIKSTVINECAVLSFKSNGENIPPKLFLPI